MIPVPERGPGLKDLGVTSYGNNFFPDKVKSHDLRRFTIVKMTTNRIAHIRVQLSQAVGLSHDGLTQRASQVAAFGCFLHHKDDLVHLTILTYADECGLS